MNAREVLNPTDSILSQGMVSSVSTRNTSNQRSLSSGNDSKGDSSSQENSKSATGNQLDTPSTLFQMRRTSFRALGVPPWSKTASENRYNTDRSKKFRWRKFQHR
ncbi:CGH_1_HP_G0099360.mRNA.1.CDS.1 [Saccharomyces cerevisiae]|nr:CGH_1_HP_G0099360.mRNA.1.CDS.1 [Saccharomyces cerevisiae]CAI6946143.1 CGH_1_HP_G0099360.mRNA.1.CDS.1 [Saccharomyces cerevisiae]